MRQLGCGNVVAGICCALSCVWGCEAPEDDAVRGRPNVLLIVADDLRYSLGCLLVTYPRIHLALTTLLKRVFDLSRLTVSTVVWTFPDEFPTGLYPNQSGV